MLSWAAERRGRRRRDRRRDAPGFLDPPAAVTLPDFRPAHRGCAGPTRRRSGPALFPAWAVRGPVETIDVPVAAGTRVRIVLTLPKAKPRGTLLLIHGLGGSAESGYMRRTAVLALERGWAVARLNLRNCGAPRRSPRRCTTRDKAMTRMRPSQHSR